MSQTMSPPPPPDAAPMDAPMPEGADMAAAPEATVVVTITSTPDGGFMVYAGDEPEEGMDADPMAGDAMGGPMGAAPGAMPEGDAMAAPEGQPADSVGAALKIALDILSKGDAGAAEDNFAGGFGGPPPSAPPAMGAGR